MRTCPTPSDHWPAEKGDGKLSPYIARRYRRIGDTVKSFAPVGPHDPDLPVAHLLDPRIHRHCGHRVGFEEIGISWHFPLVVDDLWEYNETMPKKGSPPLEGELLQGTLDLLILQTLVLGPAHGHTIAYAIEHRSEDVLQVEHGSLYPALHRLEDRGWIASFWGTSENNRRARYYRLTPAGRKQLAHQTSRWDELVRAINRVLRPERAVDSGQ